MISHLTQGAGGHMKTAQQVADYVNGTLHGDGDTPLRGVGSLQHASSGALAYAEAKYVDRVEASQASCILVPPGDIPQRTVIVVDNPRVAFARAAQWIVPPTLPAPGVHDTALIAPDATIGAAVSIGAWTVVESGAHIGNGTSIFPGAYIGRGCHVGEQSILYPKVILYPGSRLGDRVILHAGVIIGADGFGFVFDGERHLKVPQVGTVRIKSDVEIGANSCVDRGAFDETFIDSGAKLDNLCQVAHNVQIGTHAIISSQTGIAGSSTIGREAMIGGQVGIADYCRVDDYGVVGAQCGIPTRKRIPAGQVFWGTPARPLKDIKQQQAELGRLPKMRAEIQKLREELETLKTTLHSKNS